LVHAYTDLEAERLLSDPRFQRDWQTLYQACPWGTCFQDVPFVTAWYQCYANEFRPVIVTGQTDGRLSGLFTLALDRTTGALHPAGTHQAEYHAWLAEPAAGSRSIEEMLDQLERMFPRRQLLFLFLPPQTPIDWTSKWSARCQLRPIPRALLRTQPAEEARQSLRKKSNKSRLSRLAQEGPVSFTRITDAGMFRAVLDEIGDLCDFRHGAVHGVLPFRDDRLKKAFYMAMMEQGLLHVTVLRVGDRIAAAHMGQCNRSQVLLGILVHSPFLARHSPGKLHLLLLALRLEQEGFHALDLTPGAEFKDRFASHWDEAYVMQIFFSHSAAWAFRARRAVVGLGKRYVEAGRAKRVLRIARHKVSLLRPGSIAGKLWRLAKRFCYELREYRVYRCAAETVSCPPPAAMHRDCLQDLICYAPTEAWQQPVDGFLQDAAERLDQGGHVYTHVEDGRLVHYGWMIERQQRALIAEVGQALDMPPDSAVLYDFYTHPAYRGRGLYQQALAQMTCDAAKIPGTKYIYIGALRENAASCHVIEKAGFQYRNSLFQRRLLGRVKRW